MFRRRRNSAMSSFVLPKPISCTCAWFPRSVSIHSRRSPSPGCRPAADCRGASRRADRADPSARRLRSGSSTAPSARAPGLAARPVSRSPPLRVFALRQLGFDVADVFALRLGAIDLALNSSFFAFCSSSTGGSSGRPGRARPPMRGTTAGRDAPHLRVAAGCSRALGLGQKVDANHDGRRSLSLRSARPNATTACDVRP